jgi:hypothetical protein
MSIGPLSIEAYRVVGETLMALREATRRALHSAFGDRWFEVALPQDMYARLVARKEREKSVNAYNSDYFTLIEYADFADLAEILEHNKEIAALLQPVSPNPGVRQTRILELHSLHKKVGGMRDINEAELTFLRNFSTRLQPVLELLRDLKPDRSLWPRTSAGLPEPWPAVSPPPPATAAPASAAPTPAQPQAAPPQLRPAGAAAPHPAAQPRPEDQLAALSAAHAPRHAAPAPAQPPAQPPAPPAAPAPAKGEPKEAPQEATAYLRAAAAKRTQTPAAAPAQEPAPAPPPKEESVSEIDAILERGDDRGVIDALYHEIIGLSESLMSSAGPRRPKVWEKVSESDWYGRRFSALGLRPVSGYYDLYQAAAERLRAGVSKAQLQEFLQSHSYPQVVLAMGTFFQQHRGHR